MEKAPLLNSPKTNKKVNSKSNPSSLLATLSQSPATKLADNFNSVQKESAVVLNSQKNELSQNLPKIKESEGSAFSSSVKNKYNGAPSKNIKKPQNYIVKGPSKGPNQKETKFPEKTPLKKETYSFQSVRSSDAKIEKQAQSQLDAIKLNTSVIPTKMQESGKLELSGEADLHNLSKEQDEKGHEVSLKKITASKEIGQDFGENSIIKKPSTSLLKTNHKIQGKNIKINTIKGFKLEGLDEGNINANFEPVIQSKIGEENTKYETAQSDYDQKILEEETTAETKIENEKDKSQDKQLKSVKEAHKDVNKSRTEWHNELNKTESDFAKKSGEQAKTTLGAVKTQKTIGESNAQAHINKANDDARKEKEKADREAEEKKSEKKKESGGFFGWIADKASALINALKDALNFIFKKLREAVKAIFEFAKKLVLTALEFARKAIVGLLKGFAVLLKGFLDVALAAFPAIRDKLKAKIDNFVAKAEKLVNQAFEVFKKAVTAIIDFLASAVDALLGALQAIYNFILDAINFIVAGIIKIIEFLFNLNMAAGMSIFEFFGALAEESLGGNPANPVQDIEVPMGQEKAWALAMGLETETQVVQDGKSSINDAIPVLTKPELEDSDVTLEPSPAVTMDKDFMRSLPNLKDGEKYDIGGAGENSVTTKQFQESAAYASGLSIQEEDPTTAASTENRDLEAPTEKAPHPDWLHMDDEAKLAEYNNQMLVESEKTGGAEPTQEKVTPEPSDDTTPEALVTKTGRLGVGRRLQFMGEQMVTGIKAFWNKYKGWIIAGLIAALVVIGAILFFSGGTALGVVVQAIGEALILIFGAIAVLRAMGSIWDYVKKAWAGDTKGAAKALATAFAIIVVEFFIDKILLGMGKVFKRMLKAFKATKFGKFVRRVIIVIKKAKRGTGNFIKQGISKIRGTKLVITLEKFVAKGANKLDDLRNKILTKFGFKKIWLEKHGKHIQLWGEFNPKVLLMDEEGNAILDDKGNPIFDDLKDADFDKIGKGKQIGHKTPDGVVVSDAFETRFNKMTPDQQKKALEELNSSNFDIRRAEGLKGSTPDITIPSKIKTKDLDKVTKKKTFSKADSDNLEELATTRKTEIGNPDKLREYSEQIGEAAADAHARVHGLQSVYTGSGAYTLDKVYKKGDTFYVFEAKGGGSTLGGKKVTVNGVEEFAEQGSRAYLEKTIQDMIKSGNAEKKAIARQLEEALEAGKIKYMVAQQKLSPTGDLGEFAIKEFDIIKK